MKLKQFENEITSEISMVEVAKAVLERRGEVMDFNDIIAEVSNFIEIDKKEMERRMPQFYTDMNVDGEFISLGENSWGLRGWFPIDSINEVLTHENDEEDIIPHISDDGFDDYDKAALSEELEESDDEDDEDEEYEIDEDEEDLSEYQEDIPEVDTEDEDDVELENLDVLDDNELLIDDDDEEDEDL